MPLPKFWNDKGSNNDFVVQLSILFSQIAWLMLSYMLGSAALGLASLLLGPITGAVTGFGIVALLCTYFCKTPESLEEAPRS